MKLILIICCVFMLAVAARAQEPDQALIKVQYTFIHISDTTQRDKPYIENMLLIAGKNASFYTSYDRIEQGVNTQLQLAEMRKNGIHEMHIQGKATSSTQYYFFNKENKFVSFQPMTFNYLVEDDIDKTDWKIAKDTLSFSGIHCQKATAHYKGRNWIAWFAAELPFECGPWKLHGLPGLIIEAHDDKKEVQFKFAGVQKVKAGDLAVESGVALAEPAKGFVRGLIINQVALPPEGNGLNGGYVIVTKKDYDRLKIAHDKDPDAFRSVQLGSSGMPSPPARPGNAGGNNMGGGVGGGMRGGSGGGYSSDGRGYGISVTFSPIPPVNNPIELPEK